MTKLKPYKRSGAAFKRERVNRLRYRTRDEARADPFESIEVFYNRKQRHGYLGNVSPADFEERSAGSFETATETGQDRSRPAFLPNDRCIPL